MKGTPRSYVPVHIPKGWGWFRKALDRACEKTGKSAGKLLREAFCERSQDEDAELKAKWKSYKDLNEDD